MRSRRPFILVAFTVAAATLHALAQTNQAPLFLFIKGGGSVSPLTNGELLTVGQTYTMVATPDRGFAFSSWQAVHVFTITDVYVDDGGNAHTNVDVIVSPVPTNTTNQPSLDFIMQPVDVVSNSGGTNVSTITRNTGWQANFELVVLNIQFSGTGVILRWTNAPYSLQEAATPFGAYTNVPGAASPYTNSASGPPLYFRLMSD